MAVFLVLGQTLRGLGQPLFSVPQTTLRQSLVPDHVLGRVNATWRFLVFGAQPVGALLGGALGATLGLRATLIVGSIGILAAGLRGGLVTGAIAPADPRPGRLSGPLSAGVSRQWPANALPEK